MHTTIDIDDKWLLYAKHQAVQQRKIIGDVPRFKPISGFPIMVFMLNLGLYEYFGLIVIFYSNEQEPIHSTNTNRGQITI
jgi:hypothetical protein